MNGEQWSKLLAKNSLSDKEWDEAFSSATFWCSSPIGVLILEDKAVKDPSESSIFELTKKDKEMENKMDDVQSELGSRFHTAITFENLVEAKKIWNRIMEIKK